MLLLWDLYEIRCDYGSLQGIKLRGRIRKFALEQDLTCLIENASDEDNVVRFAVVTGTDPSSVSDFIKTILPQAAISDVLRNVPNPVLSKIKVNDLSRYGI